MAMSRRRTACCAPRAVKRPGGRSMPFLDLGGRMRRLRRRQGMMTDDPWSVLIGHQAEVARRFLADRDRERKHLVVYLSGAHAYGFPSPDSDLDLKCVHVA